MSSIIGNGINSAIASGQYGLQKAYEGVTQASMNIAQQSARNSVTDDGPQQGNADAAVKGRKNISDAVPQAQDSKTSDLISLKLNSINAQASAKVLDVAYDSVGKLIDTVA